MAKNTNAVTTVMAIVYAVLLTIPQQVKIAVMLSGALSLIAGIICYWIYRNDKNTLNLIVTIVYFIIGVFLLTLGYTR